jgi:hypothetical protein
MKYSVDETNKVIEVSGNPTLSVFLDTMSIRFPNSSWKDYTIKMVGIAMSHQKTTEDIRTELLAQAQASGVGMKTIMEIIFAKSREELDALVKGLNRCLNSKPQKWSGTNISL